MNKPFHERRRQPFVTEAYFQALGTHFASSKAFWLENLPEADTPEQARSLAAANVADNAFMLLSIRYTAGIPIEELRSELTGVIEAYEHYQKALAAYEGIPNAAPLGMGNIGGYERCMQLIGLCYLLRRTDLLPRIAALQDPGYFGEDALYEDLLRYALPDRADTDEMLHIETYDPLLGAMYGDDDECPQLLGDYLKQWYPAFKYVPWHDGHLRIDGTDGDYFGYWAFEAGAVALLCNIDDSQISHLVYPKDLVAWAKENADRFPDGGKGNTPKSRPNVPANQPCPEVGWWFTPAQTGSRRYFKQGEVMPSVGSDYGLTFWQWSPDQSAPKL
jgi:hypothetical protein